MQAFDASSIIYAWDNYPIGQFPGLWEWMKQRVECGLICMSAVAVEEVGHKAPDCAAWLRNNQLQHIAATPSRPLVCFRERSGRHPSPAQH